jgi:hypothetical protein
MLFPRNESEGNDWSSAVAAVVVLAIAVCVVAIWRSW